jgi:hypothetical protein
MEKQTVIDWLEQKIDGVVNCMPQGNRLLVKKVLRQAKEMEKQQIEEAWENGYDHGACVNTDEDKYHGTQYYKENYEKH